VTGRALSLKRESLTELGEAELFAVAGAQALTMTCTTPCQYDVPTYRVCPTTPVNECIRQDLRPTRLDCIT
jgi:hypothetical protein